VALNGIGGLAATLVPVRPGAEGVDERDGAGINEQAGTRSQRNAATPPSGRRGVDAYMSAAAPPQASASETPPALEGPLTYGRRAPTQASLAALGIQLDVTG